MDNLQFVLCLQDLTKEEKTELMKKVLPNVCVMEGLSCVGLTSVYNPTQERPSITQTPSDESETIPTSDPEVSVYCQINQWESRGSRKVEKSSKIEKTSKIELYKNFEKVTKRDVRRDTLQNFDDVYEDIKNGKEEDGKRRDTIFEYKKLMQENEQEIEEIPASSHCLAPAKRIGCKKCDKTFATLKTLEKHVNKYHM